MEEFVARLAKVAEFIEGIVADKEALKEAEARVAELEAAVAGKDVVIAEMTAAAEAHAAKDNREKAAAKIVEEREKNGKFKNYKDFCDRCEVTKIANIKTVAALEKEGALDFNQKRWLARVEKYNVSLYGRSL